MWQENVRQRCEIDYRRANQVLPPLYRRHEAGLEPYDQPIVQAAEFLPKTLVWGSREHALYLFLLCIWMKGGIISAVAVDKLTRFYGDHPEMFLPENFKDLSENELDSVIGWLGIELPKYGLGVNIEDSKKTWVWNMVKLARHWGSNPVRIFSDSEGGAKRAWKSVRAAEKHYNKIAKNLIRLPSQTPDVFMSSATGFWGFQHKMVSMIIYFYTHAGIIRKIPYPAPIDFHVLRVLFSTGVLKMHPNKKEKWGTHMWDYRERHLRYARKVTLYMVVKMKWDPDKHAESLWLLSQVWCHQHPGNSASVEKSTLRKARARIISHPPWEWNETNKRRYDTTCGRCPVERFCEWNIPSAYYYVKGVIKLHSRRERSQQPMLMAFDVPSKQTNGNGHKPKRELPVLAEAHPSLFE